MDRSRKTPEEKINTKLLKNFSEVDSLKRLVDKDSITTTSVMAGVDRPYIQKDVNDFAKDQI